MVIPAVRHEVVVSAPIERAFRVFTDGFGLWWPRNHTIASFPVERAIIEPWAGGRCYDRGADGSECDWGQVLVWDREGILAPDDERLSPAKRSLAEATNPGCTRGQLGDALDGADVFIGVSAGNILAVEDLGRMAPGAVVFPLALDRRQRIGAKRDQRASREEHDQQESAGVGEARHAAALALDIPQLICDVIRFPEPTHAPCVQAPGR